jgi:hypothetical protein
MSSITSQKKKECFFVCTYVRIRAIRGFCLDSRSETSLGQSPNLDALRQVRPDFLQDPQHMLLLISIRFSNFQARWRFKKKTIFEALCAALARPKMTSPKVLLFYNVFGLEINTREARTTQVELGQ